MDRRKKTILVARRNGPLPSYHTNNPVLSRSRFEAIDGGKQLSVTQITVTPRSEGLKTMTAPHLDKMLEDKDSREQQQELPPIIRVKYLSCSVLPCTIAARQTIPQRDDD